MATFPRARFWLGLLVVTAGALGYPPSAHATRVDVDDPAVLGPLLRRDFIYHANEYERAITDVRYAAGVYSYIYAVSSTPYFPGTSCCEAGIVSFSVTGHPLEATWGAIHGSDVHWTAFPDSPSTTKTVASITRLYDGFLVVPQPGPGRYTVVYMQSPFPPSPDGKLTYTGRVRDWDQGGIVRVESFGRGGVLVPVPEPASIVLFGLGLTSLAANRHRRRREPPASVLKRLGAQQV
jgi:hypothetical protein